MTEFVKLEEVSKEVSLNITLGVIFNTQTRKILLVKRKKAANITGLKWCFPGGRVEPGKDLEKGLKEKIKEKIGVEIESLGSIFAESHSKDNGDLLSVYYLCEFISGEGLLNEELEEIKWVDPSEIENYLGEKLNPKLKEYLSNIK